jgi:RecQ family ATP-dependent DNA helicase
MLVVCILFHCNRMDDHLKQVYGFNNFRKYQYEIISDLLNKKDVFVIMPTGGGKSLLYQFPATYTNKITIVISPLISLMNDQCLYLNSVDIKATCLNSETRVNVSCYTNYKIIYTTPEFFISRIVVFKKIVDSIGLFAIDEAHCISQWSHDFRTSYQKLKQIKRSFPMIPLLAVTATATPRVKNEIYTLLQMPDAEEYALGTRRDNLKIVVAPKRSFKIIKYTTPTIVYVQTRKICERMYAKYKQHGVSCGCYHGGMSKVDKDTNHRLFIRGDILLIIATISFGMGIDKSDIRNIINYGPPSNIESYYQEIGRAGRDGVLSSATMYYDNNDFSTTTYLISLSTNEKQIQIKTEGMEMFRNYLNEEYVCRQQMLNNYFHTGSIALPTTDSTTPCLICDNCKRIASQNVPPLINIDTYAGEIVQVIYKQGVSGYNYGMTKTIKLIQLNTSDRFKGPYKKKKNIQRIIDVLISKKVLLRVKLSKFGCVITSGTCDITQILPISIRLAGVGGGRRCGVNTDVGINPRLIKVSCTTIVGIRNELAMKSNKLPCNFINETVLMNIQESRPTTIQEFALVDGISHTFITSELGTKFMERVISLNKSHITNSPKNNRRDAVAVGQMGKVVRLYKNDFSIADISRILHMKTSRVGRRIIQLLETDDTLDIDLDYFNFTDEIECKIREVISKLGSYTDVNPRVSKVKTIKNLLKDVSSTHIRLCILIMKHD